MNSDTDNLIQPNYDEIIAKKIDFLNGNSNNDIDPAMKKIVASAPSLQQELLFIETIWADKKRSHQPQPSDNVNTRFYQMLGQASEQKINATTIIVDIQSSFPGRLKLLLLKILAPLPAIQIVILMVVFLSGWQMHSMTQTLPTDTTAKLVERIDSLSTIIAVSMLQNPSATERLTGVNYIKKAGLNNQNINSILIKLLNNDHSNAVRLAIIDILASKEKTINLQQEIFTSLTFQKNSLVQLALIQLLLNLSKEPSQILIQELLAKKELSPEALQYLKKIDSLDLEKVKAI